MLKIPHHADGTGSVIQNHHRSGSQTATGFLYLRVVHGHIEVFFYEEVCRCAAGQNSAKLQSVTHAASMLLDDFSHRCAKWQFPKPRPVDFPADAVQLRTAVLRAAQ